MISFTQGSDKMATNYEKKFEKDYQKLTEKYDKKNEDYKLLKYEYQLLEKKYNKANNDFESKAKKKYQPLINAKDKIITEKDKIIEEQSKEIDRLKALLNNDGTNSSIPTSQTPINKQKVVPNTRVKTGKKIGGQLGHKKHKLEKFSKNEVNDNVEHTLEVCPCCGGNLEEIGEICKDELTYLFVPIKRRHHFKKYKCSKCNKESHELIPTRLKEENQYGSEIQSVALSLANEGNVPMNKIRRLIKGFSNGEIDMSEGYISKLQKRASDKLKQFKKDLYKKVLQLKLLYWDDTVIMINTKRSCLRFYGNDNIAYYTAHLKKDEEGINEDQVLTTLADDVKVMHDHNKINYKYSYQNLECNAHLIRDLEKCKNNTSHEWCSKFKELVQKTIHDSKEYISQDQMMFPENYIKDFDEQYESIILEAIEENKTKPKTHYDNEEKALITRILEYKGNYFLWLYDFTLPTSNNLSERSLRGVKSKMKVAGQFQNISYAQYYADIKTYIETCYRNNINPTEALIRLMEDNPYTVDEIFGKTGDATS